MQSHINQIKDQLQDDESKRIVDDLIPPAAINMLFKRLTGRFRLIVTGILPSPIERKHKEERKRIKNPHHSKHRCFLYLYLIQL